MNFRNAFLSLIALSVLLSGADLFARAPKEHHLGPTGLTGKTSKTAITVTQVSEGSPAAGKIKKGDTIVGVNTVKFDGDPRHTFAEAIDQAETKNGDGQLSLSMKGGEQVDLQLEVIGSYSETAPYNCPKSDRIIERAAEYLATEIRKSLDPENRRSKGRFNSGATHTALLGLLATGEEKYLPLVAQAIKSTDILTPDRERVEAEAQGNYSMGYVGWYWGYDCILLGEYYLRTGDESVLPALELYAVSLAKGQDAGGLWGHRMAKNGRLPGYAQMNQSSLSCFIGMLMAKFCGIDDPALDRAIEKTSAYYKTHIGKGGFNYGVHGPNSKQFNNNGMSGSAAISMALMEEDEGVRFFSRLSATSHDNLEQGHASNFFNPLWTPLGANLSGPEVTQRFFDQSLWFFTTYRMHDGSFVRRGKEAAKEGSMTGLALLTYCLPRREIFITGKYADPKNWLNEAQAEAVVEMSRIDYESQSVDGLLAMFDHPIPQVRVRAIWALREREDNFLPGVVEMLKHGNDRQKISAMEYFGYKCPPEQADPQIETIGEILRDDEADVEVRAKAASTLSFHGEKAYRFYNDILQLIVDEEPGDRFRDIDQSLGKSLNRLCDTPYASGLVTNKELFYRAANKLIDHKRQHARAEGIKMISGVSLEDFPKVADQIMRIIHDEDRSYHSYHSWHHTIGPAIEILAGLNIKEGLPYAAGIIDRKGGKWGFKVRMLCAALPKYGANAQEALEKIKADERFDGIEEGRFRNMWQSMIAAIEEDSSPEDLVSLEKALGISRQ